MQRDRQSRQNYEAAQKGMASFSVPSNLSSSHPQFTMLLLLLCLPSASTTALYSNLAGRPPPTPWTDQPTPSISVPPMHSWPNHPTFAAQPAPEMGAAAGCEHGPGIQPGSLVHLQDVHGGLTWEGERTTPTEYFRRTELVEMVRGWIRGAAMEGQPH